MQQRLEEERRRHEHELTTLQALHTEQLQALSLHREQPADEESKREKETCHSHFDSVLGNHSYCDYFSNTMIYLIQLIFFDMNVGFG